MGEAGLFGPADRYFDKVGLHIHPKTSNMRFFTFFSISRAFFLVSRFLLIKHTRLSAIGTLIVGALFCCAGPLSAQNIYRLPSHFHGIFNGHLTSARAQGMGYTTVTTDGIGTSFYNPATISPGNAQVELSANYAAGHPYYPKSRYPFIGLSFRPIPKLALGVTKFSWIDPKSYWTTDIALQSFDTEKKKLHAYSVVAGYELMEGLHLGASGNLIHQMAIDDTITAKEFILNLGVIYDRKVDFIKHEKFSNQQIRFALSLSNALMNAKAEQRHRELLNYRDMPIIARVGAAYSFSIPASISFTQGKKYFAESPEILDLSLRLQYQDFLKHKDHIYTDHEYNSAFGIGAEAWFMKLLALRIGYYTEDRGIDVDPGERAMTSDRKQGFTWGFGANIPLQRLTAGKIPLDVEANFVTSRMMNELEDRYESLVPSVFGDKRLLFCAGLNIRWNRSN